MIGERADAARDLAFELARAGEAAQHSDAPRPPTERQQNASHSCGGPRPRRSSSLRSVACGLPFLTHPPSPPAGLLRDDVHGSLGSHSATAARGASVCEQTGFHSGSLPDTAPLRDMTFRQFRQSVDETGVELATEIPAAHSQHPFSLREEAPLALVSLTSRKRSGSLDGSGVRACSSG